MSQFWTQAYQFIVITLMKYITGFVENTKYYYNHIIQDVVECPTSERYWENVLGLRVNEHFLHTSYVCRVKNVKDKKIVETNFKILNNILPCNRNLFKWGKSNTNLCHFCQEEESASHLLFECTYAQNVWKLVNDVFQLGEIISHDDVIFDTELDLSMNYVFSVIIYMNRLAQYVITIYYIHCL